MQFRGFTHLKSLSRDELVAYLDEVGAVGNVSGGVDFVLSEIARRDQEASTDSQRHLQGEFFARVEREAARRRDHELSLSPAARKWMVFVDGENFAIRGLKALQAERIDPTPHPAHFVKDVFLWMPRSHPREYFFPQSKLILQPRAVRAHYYTSQPGDENTTLASTRQAISKLGFHADVFKKKNKDEKSKRVDVTLSKDFLLHGFQGNYDVAILITGDEDFVPLVQEVKRFGRSVCLGYPGPLGAKGLSRRLVAECDEFFDLSEPLVNSWRNFIDLMNGDLGPS